MSTITTYRRGDTSPDFSAQLLEDNGDAVQGLTGASLRFTLFRIFDSKRLVNKPALITDTAQALVKYVWAAGDLFTLGRHEVEFEVTFADGKVRTFPSKKRFLDVEPDRGGAVDPETPLCDGNGNDYQVAVGCDLYSPI